MVFIIGLPKNINKHDVIMVVGDKSSKANHFPPNHYTYKAINIIDIFLKERFRLHGVPITIVSNLDVKLTYIFGKRCFF